MTTPDTIKQQILVQAPNTSDFIINEWMRTEFQLPPSLLSECEHTFLRVWDYEFVITSIVEGKITPASGDVYTIHWASLPSVCKSTGQCGISFRTYKGKNYAVIKAWNTHKMHGSRADLLIADDCKEQ